MSRIESKPLSLPKVKTGIASRGTEPGRVGDRGNKEGQKNGGHGTDGTSRHTPGPWKAGQLIEGGIRLDRHHVYVDVFGAGRKLGRVSAYGKKENFPLVGSSRTRSKEIRTVSEAEVKANAQRLVAAVNACEGISTRTLERFADAGGNLEVRKKGGKKPIPLRRLMAALVAVGGIPTGALEDGVLTTIVRLAALGVHTLERGPEEDVSRFCRGGKNRLLSQARACITLHIRSREDADA